MAYRMPAMRRDEVYKALSQNLLMADRLDIDTQISKFVANIINRHPNPMNLVGFFYKGLTFDKSIIRYPSWQPRKELPLQFYAPMSLLVEEQKQIEQDVKIIKLYLRDVFVLGETLGDILAMTPQAYHAEIYEEVKYDLTSEDTTLEKSIIEFFLIKNREPLDKFKQYLMGKLLTDGL
jgi:hypothetical protein